LDAVVVSRDPERPGKRRFTLRQSIVVIVLAIIVALAPWLTPLMHYR
jgi:hypothetical protein